MSDEVPCDCPVEGCSFRTEIRINGMTGQTFLALHATRRTQLRAEHPLHPLAEEPTTVMPRPIAVGDAFPLGVEDVGDCPADLATDGGLYSSCSLDTGHAGPHVSTDGRYIVAVWLS